ncbi:hypothetical protein BHE90_017049 [Fusarium euwallaceae]|uniref:Transcription factor domain-containing protein n=1 Tax=Fusarium euwallaceae TaxID=1147111 RepID=A0A430KYP5_9HYPO|nr:hypothetical protein BHE90_017049 [Fusarium euwallaceae]
MSDGEDQVVNMEDFIPETDHQVVNSNRAYSIRHVAPQNGAFVCHDRRDQIPSLKPTGTLDAPSSIVDQSNDTALEVGPVASPLDPTAKTVGQTSPLSTLADPSYQQPSADHVLPAVDESDSQSPENDGSSLPRLREWTKPTTSTTAEARSSTEGAISLHQEAPNFPDGSDRCIRSERQHGSHWPGHLFDDEARLVKHFFDVLMPWFDYCWVRAPFRSFIQPRIFRDIGLLYAVLAVAARHREVTGTEYCNSNEYERECLGILIPTLNDNHATQSQDDAVLVSALMLRLLDEMTDPIDRRPVLRHVVSAPLLLRIRQHDPHPSELSNAAMAIVLRQEIYVANMTKRPVELNGHDCGLDDSLDAAPDVNWMLRIMSHTARITNYAYGSESRNETIWDQYWAYLEEWERKKPLSFRPLNDGNSLGERGGSIFPDIYYLNDCAIAARQYLETCKIILLANDPRLPALGIGRRKYIELQEERMRNGVRTICGIWLSNQLCVSARSLAGLAIAMTGELFMDPCETKQLLEIIIEAERHVAWPELKAGSQLKDFWM